MGIAASTGHTWEFRNGRANLKLAQPQQQQGQPRKLFKNQRFKNDNFDDYIFKNRNDHFPRRSGSSKRKEPQPRPRQQG
jgi:hypothetical protein